MGHPSVTNLLGVLEFTHEAVIVFTRNALWVARHSLYIRLESSFQQLVHLAVIIVIMADAKHAVDVVPNRMAE